TAVDVTNTPTDHPHLLPMIERAATNIAASPNTSNPQNSTMRQAPPVGKSARGRLDHFRGHEYVSRTRTCSA
ncbi:MAG: hypothetical protein J4N63_06840, partial [Chloroflexi bacterium]|nr:hypothetical protein [Chloroflexota bacterium]MCI0836900.1 hypothetical protein [Chloroflexota bacterium]MCI0874871.1 hypothetical protein [Chloroflexota bacterium]